MAINQPPLPYAIDALEPLISMRTMDVHYNDIYTGHIASANQLIADTGRADWPLEHIIQNAYANKETELFRHAALAWNHQFYWQSLTPARCRSQGELLAQINADFGSESKLRAALFEAATSGIGGGWVWLTASDSTLSVVHCSGEENPSMWGQTPLLTIDLWEHAYLLDHESHREDYARALIDRHLNWDFALANYRAVQSENSTHMAQFQQVPMRLK